MSALPPKADIGTQSRNLRFVLKAVQQLSLFDYLVGEQLRYMISLSIQLIASVKLMVLLRRAFHQTAR